MTKAKVLRFLLIILTFFTGLFLLFLDVDMRDINEYLLIFITTKTAGFLLAYYSVNQLKKYLKPYDDTVYIIVRFEHRDETTTEETVPMLDNKTVDVSVRYFIVDNYPMWQIRKYTVLGKK